MSLGRLLWRKRGWLAATVLGGIILAVGALWWADWACQRAAAGRVFRSVEGVPQNDVGLVLGTSKTTTRGGVNLHFKRRIEAAIALYRSGKVKHLLVSGDNHTKGYDEATDMRDALIAGGIPGEAITCDYAGFRTLDSVVRAKTVFGLEHCTIISEEFHCPRALWIAREHGLDAVAFAAPDLKSLRWSVRVKAREVLARAWCGVDLFLLHRGPKFAGPREPLVVLAEAAPTTLAQ
jgi:SanA protein